MAKALLFEVTRTVATDENGRATEIQTFKPVKWTARDMVRCAEAGCALGDQAIQNEGGADEIECRTLSTIEDMVPYKSAGKRPWSKSRS